MYALKVLLKGKFPNYKSKVLSNEQRQKNFDKKILYEN